LELLEEWSNWAELRRAGEPVPLPTVTLHLRHGRDFQGIVRGLSDSSHVLLNPPASGDRVHIPVAEIQAITDHGFGPDEPVEIAPTALQFRRNLAEWESELRFGFGVEITVENDPDPQNLAALDAFRARLREATAALASDREAYKSFARAVQKVVLEVGEDPSVRISKGTLTATTCLPVTRRMRVREIRAALEALL